MTPDLALGVVIVAAGSGTRFGDPGKALAQLAGRPMLAWSLSLFAALANTHEIVVVASPQTLDRCETLRADLCRMRSSVVQGGDTRADSVRSGLLALSSECTHVAIHDAARPLLTEALVQRVIAAALTTGAAVPAVPASDTLHVISPDGTIDSTPNRNSLRAAQTPQIARRDWLEHAYRVGTGATDDGGLLRSAGYPVALVDGDHDNVKITWPADLTLAEALLAARERAT